MKKMWHEILCKVVSTGLQYLLEIDFDHIEIIKII